MNTLLIFCLLLATLLSVDASPINPANLTIVPYSSEADIANFYFKGCIPGTTKITKLENGATEYECKKEKKGFSTLANQHTFGTNLLVYTSSGSVDVSIGGSGGGFGSSAQKFQFGGYVNAAWGTARAVVYPAKRTINEVENAPRVTSSDGAFWFDVYEGVCIFGFSNREWERGCPLLMVIKFSVNP
jgi:hypothetical protein